MADSTIENLFDEQRRFEPPALYCKDQANTSVIPASTSKSQDHEAFWEAQQAENFEWFKKWDKVLGLGPALGAVVCRWQAQYHNANCLDRHLGTSTQDKAAFFWEGEPGDTRILSYQELHREVCIFANGLKETWH